MFILNALSEAEVFLKKKLVGIVPTDTVYGLVGMAMDSNTVEKIYSVKERTTTKPCIILISSIQEISLFDIILTEQEKKFLELIWPGAVSVIISCPSQKFEYLHRGKDALAFRLPNNLEILSLIHNTGPLIAPSANKENQLTVDNISNAIKMFDDHLDFYVDGGKLQSEPSTLVKLSINNQPEILRRGRVKNDEILAAYNKSLC